MKIHAGPFEIDLHGKGRYAAGAVAFVLLLLFVLWLYGEDLRLWLKDWIATHGPSVVTWVLAGLLDLLPLDGPHALSLMLGLGLGASAVALIASLRPSRSTPVAGSDSFGEVPKQQKPLSLRKRCEKIADEIEAAVAKYDHAPLEIQNRLRPEFNWFIPQLSTIYRELQARHISVQAWWTVAQHGTLDRLSAMAVVDELRGIDWEQG